MSGNRYKVVPESMYTQASTDNKYAKDLDESASTLYQQMEGMGDFWEDEGFQEGLVTHRVGMKKTVEHVGLVQEGATVLGSVGDQAGQTVKMVANSLRA